ncbi:MAG: hypothetical protein K6G33_00935 [Ruminococcus sp.]|uniref:hypothetical protein n=1 Tax=Ruminococcus sp. TaxID=41978 RepID=UPI0025DAB9F1|nr:hypothetical protein [Ruminococcus sp.]MCR5599299.1 hypothetical protein [Ruminococcus sp.]
MNEKLKLIRQPVKTTSTAASVRSSALILLFGTVLGLFSKWLDALAPNDDIWWQRIISRLDLNNVFSEFAIWLLLALIVSVYSYTPLKAAINTFLFFGGMCVAYHVYTVVYCGFDPSDYMKIWYGITLISPLLAVICWYGKSSHPVSIAVDTVIFAVMACVCFSIMMISFGFKSLIDTVIFGCAILVIYRSPKQITISVIAGIVLAFPLSRFVNIVLPS